MVVALEPSTRSQRDGLSHALPQRSHRFSAAPNAQPIGRPTATAGSPVRASSSFRPTFVGCSVGPSIAQANAVHQSEPGDPYAAHIAEASRRFAVPAAWIRAVIRKESAGDARAVSSAGALGLMQIMPGTWEELRARWPLGQDPFDPRDNILAGTAYLREMHDRFGSPGFLAAYNAGPARYEGDLAGHPLPAETLAYVATLSPMINGGSLAERASTPAAPGDGNAAVAPLTALRSSPRRH